MTNREASLTGYHIPCSHLYSIIAPSAVLNLSVDPPSSGRPTSGDHGNQGRQQPGLDMDTTSFTLEDFTRHEGARRNQHGGNLNQVGEGRYGKGGVGGGHGSNNFPSARLTAIPAIFPNMMAESGVGRPSLGWDGATNWVIGVTKLGTKLATWTTRTLESTVMSGLLQGIKFPVGLAMALFGNLHHQTKMIESSNEPCKMPIQLNKSAESFLGNLPGNFSSEVSLTSHSDDNLDKRHCESFPVGYLPRFTLRAWQGVVQWATNIWTRFAGIDEGPVERVGYSLCRLHDVLP